MLRTRIIPVLLLKNNGLVKTVKFKNEKYVGDPINAVKIFNEKEVDELIFLDITASQQKRKPDFTYIEDIATECFMPFGYGGGLKTIDDIKNLFAVGAEKAILNSIALEDKKFITKAAEYFGSQSIIVSIDVKKTILGQYRVYSHVDRKLTRVDPVQFAIEMEQLGAGEVFLNSVDQDGTMDGFDHQVYQAVCKRLTIPVVACGGAGKLTDFSSIVNECGVSAVAAGSFFVFHGKHRAVLITYPEYKELERLLV
jgi:cyclase